MKNYVIVSGLLFSMLSALAFAIGFETMKDKDSGNVFLLPFIVGVLVLFLIGFEARNIIREKTCSLKKIIVLLLVLAVVWIILILIFIQFTPLLNEL